MILNERTNYNSFGMINKKIVRHRNLCVFLNK